jgi:zinc transport system substrate-binding protein
MILSINKGRASVAWCPRGSLFAVMLISTLLALSACGGEAPPSGTPEASGRALSVVAGFYPIAYFAQLIGGERVDVYNPVPPGAEPHDLELTPRSIERIQGSRVFLYLGKGFQPAVDRALDTLKGPNLILKDVSEGIEFISGDEEQGNSSTEAGSEAEPAVDPHVWLDPVHAQAIAANIADALTQADPSGAAVYRAGADKLAAELQALDSEFKQSLGNCKRKELITSHAAFAYLAKRYGLEQVSIAGLSPEAEPSPARLQEIINFAREHDAKYIFFETLADPKVSELVARETGAQTLVLNPIEGLTEEQAAQGSDYFSLMRDNLANLKIALDCGT